MCQKGAHDTGRFRPTGRFRFDTRHFSVIQNATAPFQLETDSTAGGAEQFAERLTGGLAINTLLKNPLPG